MLIWDDVPGTMMRNELHNSAAAVWALAERRRPLLRLLSLSISGESCSILPPARALGVPPLQREDGAPPPLPPTPARTGRGS